MNEFRHHSIRNALVWLALLALTAVSYWLVKVELVSWLGTTLALAIAALKVTLVVLFFMHLIEERFVVAAVAIATAAWIVLLCLGIASDVALR